MKYIPPASGPYESGLTAQSLVDVVESLIQKYFGLEKAKRLVEAESNAAVVWDNPKFRGEVEEYISSYLTDGMRETIPENGKATIDGNLERLELFKEFLKEITPKRGSVQASEESSLATLNSRADRFYVELKRILEIDCDYTIKKIAHDGLGNIYLPYHGRIHLASLTAK